MTYYYIQVKEVLTLYGVTVTGRPLRDILEEVRTFVTERSDSDYSDSEDEDERTMFSSTSASPRERQFDSFTNQSNGKYALIYNFYNVIERFVYYDKAKRCKHFLANQPLASEKRKQN